MTPKSGQLAGLYPPGQMSRRARQASFTRSRTLRICDSIPGPIYCIVHTIVNYEINKYFNPLCSITLTLVIFLSVCCCVEMFWHCVNLNNSPTTSGINCISNPFRFLPRSPFPRDLSSEASFHHHPPGKNHCGSLASKRHG